MTKRSFTCGLEATLAILSGKWKLLIIFHLAKKTHRYGELKRTISGVTDKMLIQQLKELHIDNIIDRIDYHEVPPKVEYSLTPMGQSLVKTLEPMCTWGSENTLLIEQIIASRQDETPENNESR